MSERRIFRLVTREVRARCIDFISRCPDGVMVKVEPERRSLEQNSKLWPVLGDIAAQVEWYGQKLADSEWKDVLTAALKRQKVVPGIDGGFVVLGSSTSRMSKSEMSELLELAMAFGTQRGVEWSDPNVVPMGATAGTPSVHIVQREGK